MIVGLKGPGPIHYWTCPLQFLACIALSCFGFSHPDTPVDRMPPLVAMLAELIEECHRVATGDDCYDGEYAECLVTALKPHYDDLLDYMEYRQEWRSRPGYTGGSSR